MALHILDEKPRSAKGLEVIWKVPLVDVERIAKFWAELWTKNVEVHFIS